MDWQDVARRTGTVSMWHGFGRWQDGVAGLGWPERTVFVDPFFKEPPAGVIIRQDRVMFTAGGISVLYGLCEMVDPVVIDALKDAGLSFHVGGLAGDDCPICKVHPMTNAWIDAMLPLGQLEYAYPSERGCLHQTPEHTAVCWTALRYGRGGDVHLVGAA
jgi:hypothetical protein